MDCQACGKGPLQDGRLTGPLLMMPVEFRVKGQSDWTKATQVAALACQHCGDVRLQLQRA